MKTLFSNSVRSIILLALILLASQLYAQRGMHRGMNYQRGENTPGWRHNMAIPGLTEDQQQKIDKLNLDFDRNTLQKHNLIVEKEAQLRTAVTQPVVILDKTDKLIDEISKLRSEIRKERIKTDVQIRELLNEDQKVIFDRMRSGRPGYGYGRS